MIEERLFPSAVKLPAWASEHYERALHMIAQLPEPVALIGGVLCGALVGLLIWHYFEWRLTQRRDDF